MRIFFRTLAHSDPTLFVFHFGVWCIVCGTSLVLPGNVFDFGPAWSQLQAIHADDTAWGWLMVATGILQLSAIRWERIPYRAAVSITTAIVWLPLGLSLLVSGYRAGFASVIGAYSLVGAAGSIFAVEQWVRLRGGSGDGSR